MMISDRDILLQLEDAELSALCRITFSKATGPGGQKRNKTSSAVTVELPALGLSSSDCTERSQFRNRAKALKKLRMQIALNYRKTPSVIPENPDCSIHSPGYPLFAARVLDILAECDLDHKTAAGRCNISPSALLKKLYRDPLLWQFFQQLRKKRQLPLLHPPE
ncbi:MAG: peptide chain release factor-like protein [Lentisphaerae bacterium]|nr:peptide chain release factor-like protein [Lentisphaerota bacterium]